MSLTTAPSASWGSIASDRSGRYLAAVMYNGPSMYTSTSGINNNNNNIILLLIQVILLLITTMKVVKVGMKYLYKLQAVICLDQ